MHDDAVQVLDRVERLLGQWLRPAVTRGALACEVAAWDVPGEPVPATEALGATYAPVVVGHPWGRPWGTTWLRISGRVPGAWDPASAELVVDLGFDGCSPGFQAEGLAFDASGVPLKGIAPRACRLPLSLVGAAAGDPLLVYVEAAANPAIMGGDGSFLPTALGDRATAGDAAMYRLGAVELVAVDETVWGLCLDVEVLDGLARELAPFDPRRHEILRALSRMADRVDVADVAGSADAARGELAAMLARPASASAHRVMAVGHAHIDSAWLWPVRETVRKCARTFANVLALRQRYPELLFACSQAQQYAWVRDHYPALYDRVRAAVADGSWVPVGGTWVEPDGNLCGGESLVRQLVLGRRFFADELGVACPEVWLPDSFGYSAAWPQLARLAGARYFLTQKLSWNQTNTFPHSTFLWEGIDGSRIFTHFPPVATYNAELTPAELARSSRQYAEHGRGTVSLVPFGYGDGGGGPTREMLERARRQRDLEGSPRVEIASPADFFSEAEAEYEDPPVWSGELYLETHRGTFTSQARLKAGNRRCEHLLREAELWSTAALVRADVGYPYDELERAWETLLLLQFHDILPGSSIAWVNDEAVEAYDRLERALEATIDRVTTALAGEGGRPIAFNAGPRPLGGIDALGAAPLAGAAPGSGAARPRREAQAPEGLPVSVEAGPEPGMTVLDNGLLRVLVDTDGLLASVRDLAADREVLPPGARANLLQLHRDLPSRWDAWDIDASYRDAVSDLTGCDGIDVVTASRDEAVVEVRRCFGARDASLALQRIRLRRGERRLELATEVEWQESEKLLKVAFPLDLRAEHSSAEIQFGHVRRPIHVNTSWDAARYEIYAHRWIHVGEAGYGVAVANDATYGHDVQRTTRPDGGTTTTVRLSLLRGPRFPDPRADHGHHRFGYVLVPGAGIAEAVAEGYRANLPLRVVSGAAAVAPLVTVDDGGVGAVVVESVKAADDRSGDVVVRCYEALGGRARAELTPGFAATGAVCADLLEQPLPSPALERTAAGSFSLELRPFQVLTVVLRRRP